MSAAGEVAATRSDTTRGRGSGNSMSANLARVKLLKTLYVFLAVATSGVIAWNVRSGRTSTFDLRVTTAIQRRKHPLFARVMWVASWAGFPPQSRTLPALWPLVWLAAGHPLQAATQLLGWGTSGVSFLVKATMKRPRPHVDECMVIPARIGGTSFPSGHVINYTGVYATMAVLLADTRLPRPVRRLLLGAIGLKLALIGPSRIYLGHHWFTDVVTSYLLGSSYVIVLISVYRRLRAR